MTSASRSTTADIACVVVLPEEGIAQGEMSWAGRGCFAHPIITQVVNIEL